MFCAPKVISGGTEGVGSRFHVLRARTHFRRYRRCMVPSTCFVLPDMFSTVLYASRHVYMFCAPVLIFGGPEGDRSYFHVLHAGTRFWRYERRQVPFSCFVLPDMFLAVRRLSGPVFMFCALGQVFGGNEGVGCHFHVLRSQSRFQRYRGRRVPFSSFALPDSFSEVPRALGPVFMFFALGLVFGAMECVRTRFPVLRARTHFRWYRGRLFLFSCFTRLDSFSAVPRASVSFFMFCAPGHFFGGAECVGSHFHVLRAQTGFGDPEGDVSRFHVLRASSSFQRHRGRRVPFSYFALPDTF
jgi:hypothetical protein